MAMLDSSGVLVMSGTLVLSSWAASLEDWLKEHLVASTSAGAVDNVWRVVDGFTRKNCEKFDWQSINQNSAAFEQKRLKRRRCKCCKAILSAKREHFSIPRSWSDKVTDNWQTVPPQQMYSTVLYVTTSLHLSRLNGSIEVCLGLMSTKDWAWPVPVCAAFFPSLNLAGMSEMERRGSQSYFFQ